MVEQACTNFMGGTFAAVGSCDTSASGDKDDTSGGAEGDESGMSHGGKGWSMGEASICSIAPGAIGAAHQAGNSPGYRSDCSGTPGESSPYMWPLKWTAETMWQSMPFGSDEVAYKSTGKVYYQLDKNWKRMDRYTEEGQLRAIFDPNNERVATRTTVLHRGGRMVFIKWGNGTDTMEDITNIAECSWTNLQVVGNIRPDWFLDGRGDSTDTQYLGNQHVFYASDAPRLVKQWRKKDFASQYFTMSMGENPTTDENGIHWPLMMNVPGEGFGDDSLIVYRNHAELTDDDDGLFLIDEAYMSAGGECPLRAEGGGPPTDREHIPSNLEVDEGWISNQYTFSPVWVPPIEEVVEEEYTNDLNDPLALTQAGDEVTVASCFDPIENEVHLTAMFEDIRTDDGNIPWLALAFREDEDCLMNPRDGGDTEVIFILADDDGQVSATHGPMSPSARRMGRGTEADDILGAQVPLDEAIGFSHGSVSIEDDIVSLHFRRTMEPTTPTGVAISRSSEVDPPQVMHLTYAVGTRQELGYHRVRKCFEVTEFPLCGRMREENAKVEESKKKEKEITEVEASGDEKKDTSSSTERFSIFVSTILVLTGTVFFI